MSGASGARTYRRWAVRRPGGTLWSVTTVVIAAVAALLLLSGCGSDTSSSTKASPTAVALPADFPTDEVPLIGGAAVLSAGGSADEGWNVTVRGPADSTAALDTAVTALTGGGFREVQRNTDGGNQVVVLTAAKSGKTYTVEVGSIAGAAGGPNSVFYQVSAS